MYYKKEKMISRNLRLINILVASIIFSSIYTANLYAKVIEGDAATVINDKEYKYHYRLFDPKEKIEYKRPLSPNFSTPKDALITMFFYMKEGRASEWKNMWVFAKDTPPLAASDEQYKKAWPGWLAKDHSIVYELEYLGQNIFVTEREGGGQGSRAKFFFKKVGSEYKLNRDLFRDDFAEILDQSTFDPITGKRTVEPTALYDFEKLVPTVEISDSATVPLLYTDHSINDGKGTEVKAGSGVKGSALVFEGKGFVKLPPSVPLSLYTNNFTIGIWVKTDGVPEKPENDTGKEYYAATILSRGTSERKGYIILEVRKTKKGSARPTLFLQVGPDEQAITRSAPMLFGKWVYIEAIYDGKDLELRIDGHSTKGSEGAVLKSPLKVNEPFVYFMLGRRQSEPLCPFVGSLDELSISNEIAK